MSKRKTRYAQDEIDNWFCWGLDPKARTVYLSSVNVDTEGREAGVDASMAEYLIKGLHVLGRSNRRKISLLMNNIGGDWFHGMAIYDAIRACECPVDIEVYGSAMSMGAVILQAGRKRLMHPNSTLMIHDGYTDDGGRPVPSARAWSDYEERLRQKMYQIFADRSGYRPPSRWKRLCSHDTLLTAEEAVSWGLADVVVPPRTRFPEPAVRSIRKPVWR